MIQKKSEKGVFNFIFGKSKSNISDDDMIIVNKLEELKQDMVNIHISLDYATDPVLIDSYIYELKSLHMKYEYCLKKCKDKGIVSSLY